MAGQAKTQTAIFEEISRILTDEAYQLQNVVTQAATLRNLALAFRYAAGGPQPGAASET